MGSDGTFTYQPPADFTGPDTFDYTVDESEGLSADTTATINFTGAKIWYVDNLAASNGTGTSASPFNSLAAVAASSGTVAAGDVFLLGGGPAYAGNVTLGPSVILVGSGAPLTSAGVTLVNPAGAPPVIAGSGGRRRSRSPTATTSPGSRPERRRRRHPRPGHLLLHAHLLGVGVGHRWWRRRPRPCRRQRRRGRGRPDHRLERPSIAVRTAPAGP